MTMTRIKIDAPRAWSLPDDIRFAGGIKFYKNIPVRIVRESDWRKLMRLVRAIEKTEWLDVDTLTALDALRVWK